jgi:hypothetical protein
MGRSMIWVVAALAGVIGVVGVIMALGPDLAADFNRMLAREVASDAGRPHPVVSEDSLATLPAPVQRYVRQSGAVGKPRPASLLVTYDAQMFSKPGAPAMTGVAMQYDRFDPPKRLFFMATTMAGLPVKVSHDYDGIEAGMKVRIAGLYTMVDAGGPAFSRAETVTLLNDLCLFAPAWLTDPRLTWTAIDDRTADVTFANGPHRVSARLHFNDAGELVNFTSQDRGEVAADGTLTTKPWLTPLRDYRDFHGVRAASYGEAVWSEPTGDFAYGKFTVTHIQMN